MKNRLLLILGFIILCFSQIFLHGQNSDANLKFDIGFSIEAITDSTICLLVSIVNIHDENVLISLSKNPYVNKGETVHFSTTYSHITDPFIMPKLSLPWKLLMPKDTLFFTEVFHVTKIEELNIDFDFLHLKDYPYKRLRRKTRRRYWFTRTNDIDEGESIYLSLLDYYTMREETGVIEAFYDKIKFDEQTEP